MRVVGAVCSAFLMIAACSSFDSVEEDAGSGDAGEASVPANDAAVDSDAPALGPGVVATGETGISSLSVDATHVYWTTGGIAGHVARCPKTGCTGAPEILAPDQLNAKHVNIAGERVVWIADDTVRSVPKTGGMTFSTTAGFIASAFVVFGTTAYVTTGTGIVPCADAWTNVCNGSGGGVVTSSTVTGAFRVDSDIMVWTDTGTIRRVVVPTGALSSVGYTDPGGILAAAFESEIFWVTKDGALRAMPSSGLPDGGAPRDVATGLGGATAMAIDVTSVYVVGASTGQVVRIAKNGGTVVTIAGELASPRAIAIDTNDIWIGVAGTGQILRMSK